MLANYVSENFPFVFFLKIDSNNWHLSPLHFVDISTLSVSPGEAPPGAGQRAEDGGEGQGGEERVQGEVEQSLHAIVAQAFQRVNVVLK